MFERSQGNFKIKFEEKVFSKAFCNRIVPCHTIILKDSVRVLYPLPLIGITYQV